MIELYDHQKVALQYLRLYEGFALFHEQGPQPYSAKVVTPYGYRTIGELEVGDSVIGANGKVTTVINIYDKGIKDVYEITFSDGSVARSCKDHLWNIQHVASRSRGGGFRTVPLEYLFDKTLRHSTNWKWFIPICEPVEFEEEGELPVDPYLLGALIGDGGMSQESVYLSNSDEFVLHKVEEILLRDYPTITMKRLSEHDYRLSVSVGGENPLIDDLRSLGLMGKRSNEKFIPKVYMLSSRESRITLLQGLFDTDASCCPKSSAFEYSTSSEVLADDVTFVVQSLGGTVNRYEKVVKGSTYYRLYVTLPKGVSPFTLPRKAERHLTDKANPTRSIRKIEKVGREQVRCIEVANEDGLYLTDNFIVTHNTGKTLTMLSHILKLALAGEIESALVIAPKAAMGAWTRDIAKFSPTEQTALKQVLTVINYESVWRKGKGYDRVWDCIILDESHKIKNRTAKQTSFILKLALKAKYRYILTGTPIGNGRLEDLWSQYAFLYPKLVRGRVASELFGTWKQFTDKYCILDQYWKPYRYINVDEFQEIMDMYCHRVTKEEALDLPDKLPDEIYDIELQEKKLYKELHKDGASLDYDLLLENPLARLTKLRQVCSGFLTLEDGQVVELKSEKLKVLEDFLDGWEKKLVIFCEYKYSIQSISKLLKKLKVKHVILDGEQKNKNVWKQFQSDESTRVIICQYQSGAQGIDLFAADTIIYYEPTLSSTMLEQSRDRIHRIGQTQKCSYIHFITKNSVEEDIYKALAKYEDFSERLFTEYMTNFTRSYSGGKKK